MDIKLEDEKTDLPAPPIISNAEENEENNEIKSENEIGNYDDEEDAPLKKRPKRKRISKITSRNDNLEGFSCDMCDYIATNATSLGKYLGDILGVFFLIND